MDDHKTTSTRQSAATQDQLETLPGFRFHPTEEELLDFYLKHMVFGKKLPHDIIGFLNIYRHDPRDLPGLAKIGEREWYFFVPMDRKHGHGGRPNRTTEHGFWKATGSDRTIRSLADPKRIIGLRKTLVFYKGRAPRGIKTDWVMNEYRMPQNCTLPKEDIVLCKIYRKATSMRVLEQKAAMEEEMQSSQMAFCTSSPTVSDYNIPSFEHQNSIPTLVTQNDIVLKMEDEEEHEQEEHEQEQELEQELEDVISEENIKQEEKKTDMTISTGRAPSLLRVGLGEDENLPLLQLPKMNTDWTQDHFWTQLHSPWLDNWLLYANALGEIFDTDICIKK